MKNFKKHIEEITQKNGGISINRKYKKPTSGYMVSIRTYKNLDDMLKTKLTKNMFYGTWVDVKTGIIYYDISINVKSKKLALKKARNKKELAIFDIKNQISIYL